MIIEKNLPQFERENALLMLAGEQTARFYLAHQGIIEELELFQILNPSYTDREGFFVQNVGGRFTSSGAVYEQQKRYVHEKFTHKLKDKVAEIFEQTAFDVIYLFSPEFMANEIVQALPKKMQGRILWKIAGNLVDEHPFKVLKRIAKEKNWRRVVPTKEKTLKLEKGT